MRGRRSSKQPFAMPFLHWLTIAFAIQVFLMPSADGRDLTIMESATVNLNIVDQQADVIQKQAKSISQLTPLQCIVETHKQRLCLVPLVELSILTAFKGLLNILTVYFLMGSTFKPNGPQKKVKSESDFIEAFISSQSLTSCQPGRPRLHFPFHWREWSWKRFYLQLPPKICRFKPTNPCKDWVPLRRSEQ